MHCRFYHALGTYLAYVMFRTLCIFGHLICSLRTTCVCCCYWSLAVLRFWQVSHTIDRAVCLLLAERSGLRTSGWRFPHVGCQVRWWQTTFDRAPTLRQRAGLGGSHQPMSMTPAVKLVVSRGEGAHSPCAPLIFGAPQYFAFLGD